MKINNNILKFVSYSLIGNIVSILGTLYLTKIYSSVVFGEYGLFISNISLLSVIATLRLNWAYQNTILVTDEQEVFTAGVLLASTFSIILFIVLNVINIVRPIESNRYLIPIGLWLFSIMDILNQVGMKKGKSILIGKLKVVFFILLVALQIILFSMWGNSKNSLIYAYIVSYLVVILMTVIKFQEYLTLKKFSLKTIIQKHRRFIILSTPTSLLSTLSAELPNYLIKNFFSLELLGNYVVANRLLKKPVSLVSESISKALHPILAENKNSRKGNPALIKNTIKILGFSSIIPAIIAFFYSEDIIVYLMGVKWKETGKIVVYLLPYFIAKFIYSPVKMSFQVYNKQGLGLILFSIDSLVVFLSFLIGFYFKDFYLGLLLFSLSGLTTRLVRIAFTLKMVKTDG